MGNLFANTMLQNVMPRLFNAAAIDDRLGNAAPLPEIERVVEPAPTLCPRGST